MQQTAHTPHYIHIPILSQSVLYIKTHFDHCQKYGMQDEDLIAGGITLYYRVVAARLQLMIPV